MNYIKQIDGLRGLSVLIVIFFHLNLPGFHGGYIGVDIFFVISGFLITSIILFEKENGNFSLINFYERRVRRLLPALYLVMIFCALISPFPLMPSDLRDFGESLIATSFFGSNIFFWRESGYFESPSDLKFLLHTWSLAIEEQFYLLFPAFLIFAWNFNFKKTHIIFIIIIAFLMSISLAHLTHQDFSVASFYLLPTRAWELLSGVLVAFFLNSLFFKKMDSKTFESFANFFGLIGITLIIASLFLFNDQSTHPGLITLAPVFGTVFIILSAINNSYVSRIFNFPPIVHIGLISYSFYLWHWPINVIFNYLQLKQSGYSFLIILSISYLFSFLSWKYIEKYFRNKQKVSRKKIFSFSISGILVFLLLALGIHFSNGMSFRYPNVSDQLTRTQDEFSDYVISRSALLDFEDFDNESKKSKVLIIGDSYGSDMLNAAFEANLNQYYQFKFHYIGATCGALFLSDYKKIRDMVSESCIENRLSKIPNGEIETQEVLKMIRAADFIWLASSWKPWVINFLPESLKNLKNITRAELIIFGRKDFGPIDMKQVIESHPKSRREIIYDKQHKDFISLVKVNNKLRKITKEYHFIDFFKINCLNDEECYVCTPDGDLITYDNNHLTKEGAKYFGEQVKKILNKKNIIKSE